MRLNCLRGMCRYNKKFVLNKNPMQPTNGMPGIAINFPVGVTEHRIY